MPSSLDDFLDGYSGPVEEVPVCGRPDLIAEFAKVEAQIAGYGDNNTLGDDPKEVMDLIERLKVLESEIESTVMVFKLRAMAYQPWTDLLGQHPPEHAGLRVNPVTFEPAAIAACAVDPPMTEEQAVRLRDTVAASEWQALIAAMWRLNQGKSEVPKSLLLSVLRPASVASSASPPDTESPEAGSLAGDGEQ